MQKQLYIEEYQPDRKYVPVKDRIYADRVFDPGRRQEFYLMKEPEWFHMEKDKVYIYHVATENMPYYETGEIMFVKVWERFDDDTVLVGFWDTETNDWFVEEDSEITGLPADNEKCMPVEEYISLYKK